MNVVQPEESPVHVANNNEFDPTEILCDPALRKQIADMFQKFKTKLEGHKYALR